MSRAWIAVSVGLSAASLGVAVWALDEARQARSLAGGGAGSPAAVGGRSLESRVERLEERAPAVPVMAPVAGIPGAAPVPIVPGAPSDPARAALDGPPPEEGLRALVRQTVKEELEVREKEQGAGKGPADGEGRKPPLSQVAAELDLDDAQREAVHQAVLRGQEEMIALLRTPTAAGRVPLDDLLHAFLEKPEASREKVLEVFALLATEKVPGSGETYAQRVDAVKKAASEAFRRSFTPEQFRAYERTGQDPLEIQVPDSPWIPVLQDALKRR